MKLSDLTDQSALDALIEKVTTDATAALVAKNEEILGKLRTAKDRVMPDGVDLEALQTAAEDLKKLKDAGLEEQGEYKKLLETARTQHAEELAKMQAKLDVADGATRELLINNGLSLALGAYNVNPVLLDSAVRLLSNDVTVVDDNGKKVAQVGDKSLDLYVKDWIDSDIGKNFALAPANGGGGAGGNSEGDKTTKSEASFRTATWNLTEQAQLSKSDPELYDTLKQRFPSRDAGENAQAAS